MEKFRQNDFAFMGLILLVFSVAFLAHLFSYSSSEQSETYATKQCTQLQLQHAKSKMLENSVIKPSSANKSRESKGEPNWCDLATQQNMANSARRTEYAAWFSVVLTLAGVFLIGLTLVFTARTLDEAKETTKAAQETVRLHSDMITKLERPYVYVEVLNPGVKVYSDPISVRTNGHFKFQCFNVGRTPANIISIHDKFFTLDKNDFPDPFEEDEAEAREIPVGIVCASDKPYPEIRNMFLELRNADCNAIAMDEEVFYWMGYICYSDTLGKTYITGFCMLFDIYSSKFIFRGDQKYNYTHQKEDT